MSWICACGTNNGNEWQSCRICGRPVFVNPPAGAQHPYPPHYQQQTPPGWHPPPPHAGANYAPHSSFVNDLRGMGGVGAAKLGFGAGLGAAAGISAGRTIGKFFGCVAVIVTLIAILLAFGLVSRLFTSMTSIFKPSGSTHAVAADRTSTQREQRLGDLRRQRAEAAEEAKLFGLESGNQAVIRRPKPQITIPHNENAVSQRQDFSKADPSPIGGVYRVGGGVSPPSVLYKVDPDYSAEALRAKLSGSVMISLVVDSDGRARNIRVVRGLGLGLDGKAAEAVARWRFRPGTKDGYPVSVQATIEVNFRLL
jgi:TonB family protein